MTETPPKARPDEPDLVRYRTIIQSLAIGFCIIEVCFDEEGVATDYVFLEVNPAFEAQTGLANAVGQRMRSLAPEHEDYWFERYGHVAHTGISTHFEQEAAALGRWYSVHAFRVGRPEERQVAILFEDVTARRRDSEARRLNEARFRRIVESARDYAILVIDSKGIITDWHPGAEAVFGWTAKEAIGKSADMTFIPEDRAAHEPEKEMMTARQEGIAPDVRWHQRKDGSRVFIDGTMTPLTHASGAITGYLKIGQDVTERRAAEERQNLLLGELQHRVRNTLGVIRSIARRTAENSESTEEMSAHLDGRLDAFARVQAMVTRRPEAGVDLAALVEDELVAYAAREGEQVLVDGPAVILRAKTAETLSLAVHELATNAVKYGAFAKEGPRVRVAWATGSGRLRFSWTETGVKLNGEPPSREGFGFELLRRVVPYELQAETVVDFTPDGLRFTLDMPLAGNAA